VEAIKTASIPFRRPGSPRLSPPKSSFPERASPVAPRQRCSFSHSELKNLVIFPTQLHNEHSRRHVNDAVRCSSHSTPQWVVNTTGRPPRDGAGGTLVASAANHPFPLQSGRRASDRQCKAHNGQRLSTAPFAVRSGRAVPVAGRCQLLERRGIKSRSGPACRLWFQHDFKAIPAARQSIESAEYRSASKSLVRKHFAPLRIV
jgi:hypothetical protein